MWYCANDKMSVEDISHSWWNTNNNKVINEFCIRQAIKTGIALQATVQKVSQFDRKHYFYADMPQGYQITQQFSLCFPFPSVLHWNTTTTTTITSSHSVKQSPIEPLILGGSIKLELPNGKSKNIRLQRIQLEQDSGKSLHDQEPSLTLIDLNRAGIALMEIITQPDISSSLEAEEFIKKLQFLLRHIQTSSANMEEVWSNIFVSVNNCHFQPLIFQHFLNVVYITGWTSLRC